MNASGVNNLPSSPVSTKTGIKLRIVVKPAVIIAPETSLTPATTNSSIEPSFLFCSSFRTMFSDKIIPKSTIVPMAIAIPESATIFASTANNFIAIKTMRTATGNKPETTIDILRLRSITRTTKIAINISKYKAELSVPSVLLINSVLS